jgi:hypothetical protein
VTFSVVAESGRRRAVAAVTLVLGVILVVALTPGYARRSGDFAGYLSVGDLALAGRDVYRDSPPGINTWPPLFSLFCMPLALIAHWSLAGARLLWVLINWACVVVSVGIAVRLVSGRRLVTGLRRLGPVDQPFASTVVLLPMLLTIRWILSNFEHLQVNLVLLTLTLAGLLLHSRRHDARAGLCLGAAIALKLLPATLVPYFLWRRQWRALGWTVAAAVGWSLLPMLLWGPARFIDEAGVWLDVVRRSQGVGKMNLSVYAMLDRTLGHRLLPFSVPGADALPSSHAPLVVWAFMALLVAVTALACWQFRGSYKPRGYLAVTEWSIVLLVGAIFSPLTWKFYLIVVLLPQVLFVDAWRNHAVDPLVRRTLRWSTWVIFALGMLASDMIVGREMSWRLEMGSLISAVALMTLIQLCWLHRRIAAGGVTEPS